MSEDEGKHEKRRSKRKPVALASRVARVILI
jgi:hypothetical protein